MKFLNQLDFASPQILLAPPREVGGEPPDDGEGEGKKKKGEDEHDKEDRLNDGGSGETPPDPFPSGDPRRRAFRFMSMIGFWATALKIMDLPLPGSEARRRVDGKYLKDADMMAMMHILYMAWTPGSDFEKPPERCCVSLNRLAQALDRDRIQAISNRLRNNMLPIAQSSGLIGGFESCADGTGEDLEKTSIPRHKIHISEKGHKLVETFLDLGFNPEGE